MKTSNQLTHLNNLQIFYAVVWKYFVEEWFFEIGTAEEDGGEYFNPVVWTECV